MRREIGVAVGRQADKDTHNTHEQRAGPAMPIDTRVLFQTGDLTIHASIVEDVGATIDQDFETPEDERDFRERFERRDFQYVGLLVRVDLSGVTIGRDSLWGVEHGTVAEGIDANAFEFTPAEYHEPNVIVMGSPLAGVVVEALAQADAWLADIDTSAASDSRVMIAAATAWADPNARTTHT